MEQAIFAMQGIVLAMLGIIITLMLYLDRSRRSDIALLRADNAQLRRDMETGFKEARADNAKLREDMETGMAKLRGDMETGMAKLRGDMNEGFKWVHQRLDKLTDVVMGLCHRVGRLEGRAEIKEAPDNPA